MSEIKFGTDGWRDGIADRFTFPNVERVTQAASDVARTLSSSRLIVVGYDRRFFSEKFAKAAARVAMANGFRVELCDRPIGSPTLSHYTKARKAALGFMITASHNPYYFNGFKIKGPQGGSVDSAVTLAIEDRLGINPVAQQKNSPVFRTVDMETDYFRFLKKCVRMELLSRSRERVVVDAMHGPAGATWQRLLGKNERVSWLRTEADPLFGGSAPEPVEKNLSALKQAVISTKASAGFALDGDSDRLGVVDDKGRYLPPHTVMPLLLLHLIENRKIKGSVVQTMAMGYLPQRIAKQHNRSFEQLPVGFKYVAKRMAEQAVVLGGEESGGYGVGAWSRERDGILCASLLWEMMAMKKQPLSALVDDLHARFGSSVFERVDFALPDTLEEKQAWTERMAGLVGPAIGDVAVRESFRDDGLKIVRQDDSWVLLRPSGTEPLVRTYAEASTPAAVAVLLAEAKRLVETPPPVPKRETAAAKKRKKAEALRAR